MSAGPLQVFLCPGFVTSATDGQDHYISAGELARLYGVRDWTLYDADNIDHQMRRPRPGQLYLGPQYHANTYSEIAAVLRRLRGDGADTIEGGPELLRATTALLSALQHGAMGRSLEPFEKAARAALAKATGGAA